MMDLERRALLGDQAAQQECTEQGIVLPCPCCGGESKLKKGFPSRQIPHCRQAVVQCKKCGVRTITHRQLPMECWQDVDKHALAQWNTRSAPPVGRCGTCRRSSPDEEGLELLKQHIAMLRTHLDSVNRLADSLTADAEVFKRTREKVGE